MCVTMRSDYVYVQTLGKGHTHTLPPRAPCYAAAQLYGNLVSGSGAAPLAVQLKRASPAAGPSMQRAVGPCFACGEMGHLRLYCPRMQPQDMVSFP